MRAPPWIPLALLLLALSPLRSMAQGADKPPCRMSDPDVTLTPDGWAGPHCKTTQVGSNGAPSSPTNKSSDSTHQDVGLNGDRDDRDDNRPNHRYAIPVCRRGDKDVHRTADGWSGPNCITSKDGIHPTYAAAAPRQRKPLCKLSDPGVELTPNGWSGPDCITSKDGRTASNPAEAATTSHANAQSCFRTAGAVRANELVRQCLQVSTATHPPCNAQDSCASIRQEIRRGCAQLTEKIPGFCVDEQ